MTTSSESPWKITVPETGSANCVSLTLTMDRDLNTALVQIYPDGEGSDGMINLRDCRQDELHTPRSLDALVEKVSNLGYPEIPAEVVMQIRTALQNLRQVPGVALRSKVAA